MAKHLAPRTVDTALLEAAAEESYNWTLVLGPEPTVPLYAPAVETGLAPWLSGLTADDAKYLRKSGE